jgi:hypothetical protein
MSIIAIVVFIDDALSRIRNNAIANGLITLVAWQR